MHFLTILAVKVASSRANLRSRRTSLTSSVVLVTCFIRPQCSDSIDCGKMICCKTLESCEACGVKHHKHPISARVEDELHRRLEIIALVDRRSVADVVAECVRRALPSLEAELQQPRLSEDMVARIKAGERIEDVVRSSLAPLATPTPPAPTPKQPGSTGPISRGKRGGRLDISN